jgi:poly(A) polymerase
MNDPTRTLAWGVLLHDVGKPPTFTVRERIRFDGHAEKSAEMAVEILGRLRLSNDDIRQVEALCANHLRFKDVRKMRESTWKRFLRMDRFEEHLELHRLDCVASHGLLDNYEFCKAKLQEIPSEELKPARLLTGHDLIRAGYVPGPAFGWILQTVEDAQLESLVRTPEEALGLVGSLFEPPDGRPRTPTKAGS